MTPGDTATLQAPPAPTSQPSSLTPLFMPTPPLSPGNEKAGVNGSSNNLGTFINDGAAGSASASDRRTDPLEDPFN